jgi:hypothetical protein
MGSCELDSSGSGKGPVTDTCEHVSIECGESLD